jgi:NTE family protein
MKELSILALSGGGTRGFLQIGALQELEDRYGDLTKIFHEGIYGCSVGSLIAVGIAFGIDNKKRDLLLKKLLNFNFVTTSLNLESLKKSVDRKGIFEMDSFEETVLSGFDSCGIDLRSKVLSDARIPLYVIASNMTKGVPTIFKGSVPVMTALKASCCIPGLFRPQIIKNNVYIDGGYFANVIFKLLSKEEKQRAFGIDIVHTNPSITPANLKTMSVTEFLYKFYKLSCSYDSGNNKHPNIMAVYHSGGHGFGDPSDEEKNDMISAGRSFMRGFLSKRGL